MNSKQFLKEGFLEDAQEAHSDHEVQMARVDCYYAAEHAIVLHKLLRNISEEQGLEGWVASKITLANDYLKSVREHLEYQMMNVDAGEDDFLPLAEGLKPVKKNSVVESTAPGAEDEEEKFQDFERGPWYVILKGKAISVNGVPKKFNWLNGAKTYFRSMMDKNPEMAQKIKREYDEASDKKSVIYYTKNLPADNTTSTEQPVSEGEKPGLWANIRAKRERIKGGSGERMRKPGSKGAPSEKDLKSIRAASESTENASNTWYDNLTGKYPKTKLALDLFPPTAMATSAVDAVNNLSKGNYSAAALDAAGLIPGVKPLSKFLPRLISIDNISSGRKVARGASTAKDVGDYIDNEFPNEVKESDFHSQFSAMIDDMKKSGKLKTGDPTKSQAKYAPEPSREELTARLRELESKFDPEYQYSDDYSFWTKQNAIAREIASIKKKLGSQGVTEGYPDKDILNKAVDLYREISKKYPHKIAVQKSAQSHNLDPVKLNSYIDHGRYSSKQGVAEGSESDLVYISTDRVEAFENWMESEGLETDVPKRDEGTYVVYDYSDANHTSKMYADEWNEKKGVAEGFKNTYEVGDRVDGPLGTGTIVAVSKNVNIDGRVKVKLDDPSKAGEDGKYQDSFVLNTTQLKHISEQGVAEGLPGSSQIYDQIESLSDKLKHTSDPDKRRFYIKQIKNLEHKLHSTYDPFDIDDPAPIGKKGVVEGYILKKTKVEKTFTPGDPDEYYTSGGADVTTKDTDYEIINNKTGQVVGTASWTTNDYFGPGALKITMKNGATRWLDIWEREKGNPQTAFNRFVKDPKTAKKYKEQGVAEGLESYPEVLYHGSTQEIKGPLTPRQAHDIGGAPGSNKNAIYATDDPNFAIAYSLAERGSDTGTLGWKKDPHLIFFGGKIRHGQNVYIYILPTRDQQGQPLFTRGAADTEWHSVPGVKAITPIKTEVKPVDQYLHLLRKPTSEELKIFQANQAKDKARKQGVAEGLDNSVEALIQMYNSRDQKIVKTKVFRSEDEANRWADRNNATILKLKDIAKKSTLDETSAGSIAGVVNPKIKNKSKVGTLFGGTYKQQKDK